MRQHMKPTSKKVLENNSFVCLRQQDGLNAGRSAISFGNVVGIALYRPKVGLPDI
jgi:hypothetical protein